MTLHDKLNETMDNKDVAAYLDLLHEDFTVVFHKSGKSFSKDEWAGMVSGMIENDKFIQESSRCIYENDDILVQHNFMSYPDDSREAVILVTKLKDGKIVHMETGATTLD